MAKAKSAAAPTPPEIEHIERASLSRPTDLFGTDTSGHAAVLRRLQKAIHPDLFAGDKALQKRADAAFRKLMQLYTMVGGRVATAPAAQIGKWTVLNGYSRGDLADLYTVSAADGAQSVLKLARAARDNDLIMAEADALGLLNSPWKQHSGKLYPAAVQDKLHGYLPTLCDTITAGGRAGNVLSFEDDYIPLSRFNDIWTNGVDFRHLVWMCNRALTVLIYAHSRGLIHGAVLPEHLLYHPGKHGIKLVDWCYSVSMESGRFIPAISAPRKTMYPPEVTRKFKPVPATDLYMLMRSLAAVKADWPAAFENIKMWAMAASPNSRPQTAQELADRWEEAAEAQYGKPAFVELKLPN